MELFMLFLVGCLLAGLFGGNLNTRRQVWIVITCVVLMTTLYFINPGLL